MNKKQAIRYANKRKRVVHLAINRNKLQNGREDHEEKINELNEEIEELEKEMEELEDEM